MMQFFTLISILFAILIANLSASRLFTTQLDDDWNEFKIKFEKVYEGMIEDNERRLVWESNIKLILQHNVEADSGLHTYWLGMNRFGDLTNKEFNEMMNRYNSSKHSVSKHATLVYEGVEGAEIPTSIDWRKKGYVTPVKDQGQCGSCWAFSTVASLEGQHFKKTKKLVSLSEQNLVDCSKDENQGCDGGLVDKAFEYIISNNGIDTEDSYPYEAEDGICRFDADNVGATMSKYTTVKAGEDNLDQAVANNGPVSVAIDASHSSFQFYKSGVYYEAECSTTELDHAVTVVGYGVTSYAGLNNDSYDDNNAVQNYYIVKNSWGESWGLKGYILMARGKKNNCGIASEAYFPLV